MPLFETTDELHRVRGTLFRRIADEPELSSRLVQGDLVLRFRWREPEGEATVDLRSEPTAFKLGPADLTPDVEMIQTAEVAHRFWSGRLDVAQAIATRKVVARGSVPEHLETAAVPDTERVVTAVRTVMGG